MNSITKCFLIPERLYCILIHLILLATGSPPLECGPDSLHSPHPTLFPFPPIIPLPTPHTPLPTLFPFPQTKRSDTLTPGVEPGLIGW